LKGLITLAEHLNTNPLEAAEASGSSMKSLLTISALPGEKVRDTFFP
jgi:hypothetical protein